MAFCQWASNDDAERRVSLPSEAEWEKAARGTDGRVFPWGNDWDNEKACTLERHGRATLPFETSGPGPTEVGRYLSGASPYGALDMAGNVREMTRSLPLSYPYDPTDGRESMASGEPEVRVSRGGSWWEHWVSARCTDRGRYLPDEASNELGFRCVLGEPVSATTRDP